LPRLSVFHTDYGPHGFEAIAINLSESMDSIVKVWARQYANQYLRDDGSVWPVYLHNNALPTNYVIDTAGVIRYWSEGYNEAATKSVIEQYLPDPIEHDVGVLRLMAPTGSMDSGTVVTPACSLHNYRSYTETYPVRMRIGTRYDTTLTVTNHQPGQTVYLEFPQWTAQERGNVVVSCSTELADDDIASNDKIAGPITVNVYDVAVTAILAPPDSVDSGAVITPMAEIKNFGTMTDVVTAHFHIGSSYYDTVRISMKIGGTDTAVLGSWTALTPGTFQVRCSAASWRGDMVPTNDEMDKTVFVRSSGIEESPGPRLTAGAWGLTVSPNPTGLRTSVRYSVAHAGAVNVRVYAADGKLVRTLATGAEPAGLHQAVWNGRNDHGLAVSPGTYFCRMTAGSFHTVQTLTVVR
jgi:hypothetical protein